MTNLIIGLAAGLTAALSLTIMWRAALNLDRQIQAREEKRRTDEAK